MNAEINHTDMSQMFFYQSSAIWHAVPFISNEDISQWLGQLLPHANSIKKWELGKKKKHYTAQS